MVRSCPSYTENQYGRTPREPVKADTAVISGVLQTALTWFHSTPAEDTYAGLDWFGQPHGRQLAGGQCGRRGSASQQQLAMPGGVCVRWTLRTTSRAVISRGVPPHRRRRPPGDPPARWPSAAESVPGQAESTARSKRAAQGSGDNVMKQLDSDAVLVIWRGPG